MGGGSTQVGDLRCYCTRSGRQEGRPRDSARGSARERTGAGNVRGARAEGGARVSAGTPCHVWVRSILRSVHAATRFCRIVASHRCIWSRCASVAFAHPPPSPCLLRMCSLLGDTWLYELSPAGDYYITSLLCTRLRSENMSDARVCVRSRGSPIKYVVWLGRAVRGRIRRDQ